MRYLFITFAFVLVMLVAACGPAATATPAKPEIAPTLPAAAPAPGNVQPAQPMTSAPATPTPGQSGAAASPAAALATPTPGASRGGALVVTSTAFSEGASIPKVYSCDGSSVSPPLKWTGAPENTASFVLIVDDPDAPVGTFTHWVAFDIPSSQTEIPEGAKNIGKAGLNSAGRTGFIGPCPPSGTHRYIFTVYGLDVPSLGLNEGASRDQVTKAMQGHVLAEGKLMGRYARQ